MCVCVCLFIYLFIYLIMYIHIGGIPYDRIKSNQSKGNSDKPQGLGVVYLSYSCWLPFDNQLWQLNIHHGFETSISPGIPGATSDDTGR